MVNSAKQNLNNLVTVQLTKMMNYLDRKTLGGEGSPIPKMPRGADGRYDFGSATHICTMLTGGRCIEPYTPEVDFSQCFLRCWGWNLRGKQILIKDSAFGQRVTAPKGSPHSEINPQGRVYILTGDGTAGLSTQAPKLFFTLHEYNGRGR